LARAVAARRPLRGMGKGLALGVGLLVALALLDWLSGHWSHAPARAIPERDRTLLYALAVLFFGLCARRSWGVRLTLAGLSVAGAVICVVGLAPRRYPDVWPVEPGLAPSRRSY